MKLALDFGETELELIEVGHHSALFRPDTHAVALLNESAAAWCRDMIADARYAGAEAEMLEALRRAGFVNGAAPPRSGALNWDAVAPENPSVPTLGIYRLSQGPRVRLAVAQPALGALLDATLRPLESLASSQVDTAVVVAGSAHGLGIWRDGVAIALDLDVADARRITLQATLMALHPEATVAAILHASTILMANDAVVLAGASGSGKSTLALALVAAGAGYMADDFTALDRSGQTALGFPVAASVKDGSWPLLAKRFPELLDCAAHEVGERTVRYLDVGRGARAHTATASVGRLIFPTFKAGTPLAIAPLTPEEALGRLLASGSEVVGWPRSLRPMADLVNRVPACSLLFGDLDQAVDATQALMGQAYSQRMAS